jgi:prolipoprotein diacylglyceryl transferase
MTITQIVWNIDPVFLKLGSLQLRYYSFLFALGFILGYAIVKRMFKNEGIPLKELDNLLIYVLVGGLAGARLGHCLFYDWAYFSNHILEIFLPVQFEPKFHFTGFQGLASHGGAIGILISIAIFVKKSSMKNYLYVLDRIVIPTALAGSLIRLGNLMNSEIYGHQTDLPWGFIFARNGDTWASHPTQIYEAIVYLIIFFVLIALYKKRWKKKQDGYFSAIFLILVFTFRFFIEFVKEIQVGFERSMALDMGQILSIPFVVAGIILLIYSLRKKDKTTIIESNQ